MRGKWALPLVLVAALLTGTERSEAVQTTLPLPVLNFTLGSQVSPAKLSKREFSPVKVSIQGKVATTDGTHPSALREMVLDVDKDVTINTRGLPSCGRNRLAGRNVRDDCGAAAVGTGLARFAIPSSEGTSKVFPSFLKLFNGGTKEGKTKVVVLASLPTLTPSTAITTVTIQKRETGLHSIAKIPAIPGAGSIVDFGFELGRTYTYKDKRVSYLEAKCPDGVFKVKTPKVLFKNEAQTPGVAAQTVLKGSFAVPCTPKG